MKPRQRPLPPPSARDWIATMGPKIGAVRLRMPFFSLANRLIAFVGAHPIPDGEVTNEWLADHLPYVAACLGATWAHDLRELATPPLSSTVPLTDADLYAYGCAVGDELQSEGWPPLAISHLGVHCYSAIVDRTNAVNEASALADFLPAPTAPSTTT